MKIYEKIRTIRISKGYTQEYIAGKLNIDAVNYGRIERGQAKLPIERLMKIAEILEFDIKDLFSDNKNKTIEDDKSLKLLLRIYKIEKLIYKEIKKTNK